MLKVTILSVSGSPEIEVDANLSRAQIARIVSRRFGYQGVHLPHSWYAVAAS